MTTRQLLHTKINQMFMDTIPTKAAPAPTVVDPLAAAAPIVEPPSKKELSPEVKAEEGKSLKEVKEDEEGQDTASEDDEHNSHGSAAEAISASHAKSVVTSRCFFCQKNVTLKNELPEGQSELSCQLCQVKKGAKVFGLKGPVSVSLRSLTFCRQCMSESTKYSALQNVILKHKMPNTSVELLNQLNISGGKICGPPTPVKEQAPVLKMYMCVRICGCWNKVRRTPTIASLRVDVKTFSTDENPAMKGFKGGPLSKKRSQSEGALEQMKKRALGDLQIDPSAAAAAAAAAAGMYAGGLLPAAHAPMRAPSLPSPMNSVARGGLPGLPSGPGAAWNPMMMPFGMPGAWPAQPWGSAPMSPQQQQQDQQRQMQMMQLQMQMQMQMQMQQQMQRQQQQQPSGGTQSPQAPQNPAGFFGGGFPGMMPQSSSQPMMMPGGPSAGAGQPGFPFSGPPSFFNAFAGMGSGTPPYPWMSGAAPSTPGTPEAARKP